MRVAPRRHELGRRLRCVPNPKLMDNMRNASTHFSHNIRNKLLLKYIDDTLNNFIRIYLAYSYYNPIIYKILNV